MSDTQTRGEMRVLFVLGQPSAEIVRVGWANMWCGEMRNFFGRSNRLRRSCVSKREFLLGTGNFLQRLRRSDIQTCAKMQIWWPGAAPSHETRVNRQKLV